MGEKIFHTVSTVVSVAHTRKKKKQFYLRRSPCNLEGDILFAKGTTGVGGHF